jgi:hypothetical protein
LNAALAVAALAALLGATGALAYFQLRHLALAALVVLVPFLYSFVDPLLPRLVDDQFNNAPFVRSFFAVCGLLMADRVVRGVSSGMSRRTAVTAAVSSVAAATLPFLVALLLATAALAPDGMMRLECEALGFIVLAYGAIAFGAIWPALAFPYTEDFIMRANRARERREHAALRLAAAAQTRWALSIAGSAFVLATIAGFRLRGLSADPGAALPLYLPAAAMLVFAAALAVARDWRMALAFTLTLALSAAWMVGGAMPHVTDVEPLSYSIALATIAAPLGLLAARWSRAMRDGDAPLEALSQVLRQEASTVVFAAAYLLIYWLLHAALGRPPLDMTVIVATIAGLAVFPALTVSIQTLLPRYRSVEEVFKKR